MTEKRGDSMDIKEVFIIAGLFILLVIICMYYAKCKCGFLKKVCFLFFGALSGMAVLYPTQLILSHFGYAFSINLFTLSVSGILGIPGVALLVTVVLL